MNTKAITRTGLAPAPDSSEVSYRRLFEAAQDGILILENDTGRISDVNPFLLELLGFSRGELMGRALWELGPFRDVLCNKAKFQQLQQQGYIRYENLPLETSDGREIEVEFVCHVCQIGGRCVIQCHVRDITERKQAEQEILASNAILEQRLQERTAQWRAVTEELQEFSHSVSHNLRAPLRHVLGFVELLQRDAGSALSEQCQGHLAVIAGSAKRMGYLMDDLLAFSRLGLLEMQETEVQLDQLVREALGVLQDQTKERSIVWDLHPLPVARGDGTLLRLALVQLISNAVKFTGAREEARIEIGSIPNGPGQAVIFIRDNGVGFDPEYAGKLFGVFQRLHSRDEFEGTGIGLANVHRIIQRHGGRTWAQGEVNKGATFYFSISTPQDDLHGP